MLQVFETCCKNCLLTENRIVSPERAVAIVSGAVEKGTYFNCHVASIQGKDIVCRRFFDEYRYVSQILLIAQRLGGCVIADFPIAKYKLYNWFNKEARLKIDELRKMGYNGGGLFLIKKEYRNKEFGTLGFKEYFKSNPNKVYFTSSTGAKSFYIRNGAELYYESTYNIYTFDGNQ